MRRIQKLAVGITVVGAVVGAGGAVAAAQFTSPEEERRAVVEDAARRLGVSPERLSSALEEAMKARVDAAVEAGRLTREEGERLKRVIERRGLPIPPLGFGFEHREFGLRHFHKLEVAARYLGLSEDALRQELREGKTLAEVARDRDKSVEGLVDALLADTRERLDEAVENGRLTRAEANDLLADLRARTTARVNGRMPRRPRFHRRPPFGDVPRPFRARGPPESMRPF